MNHTLNQGEGNREADRQYRESSTQFAKSESLEPATRDAARAYADRPEVMKEAERTAAVKARDMMRKTEDDLMSMQEDLRRVRDTLRVRLHLASKDAKDAFHSLDDKWAKIEAGVKDLETASADKADVVRQKTASLLDEIKAGYERLKNRDGEES